MEPLTKDYESQEERLAVVFQQPGSAWKLLLSAYFDARCAALRVSSDNVTDNRQRLFFS